MRYCKPGTLLSLVALLAASLPVPAQGPPPGENHSILAPLAPQSLLLDGAAAGGLMAVVGERGHVLLADEGGESWHQMRVPTTATLTGVYFSDREHGWAVGHDAVILRTADGGETWERVHFAPEEERPLLDVWFSDERHGYAVGAYSYFLETSDGGLTWQDRILEASAWPVPEPAAGGADDELEYDPAEDIDVHYNAIASASAGRLYMAAEAGQIFRSDDGGRTWWSMPSPYEGSFFGVLPLGGDSVLVFGLRGHLYRSDDGGVSWEAVETSTQAMLTDGLKLDDGTIVLTGLAGTLLVSRDGARSFELVQFPNREGIAAALPGDAGKLWLIGESGLDEFTLPGGDR
ncbi:MAG: WD40/YVTN/BNR-like repeat-containing protein [Gammaproteobacteria bacterium]